MRFGDIVPLIDIDIRTGEPFLIDSATGELIGWRRYLSRRGVQLRRLEIDLRYGVTWRIVDYQMAAKDMRKFLRPTPQSRLSPGRALAALREFVRGYQVVNVRNGVITEEILNSLVLCGDAPVEVRRELRHLAMRLALDRKMWSWLGRYLSSGLPSYLCERFNSTLPGSEAFERAVSEARFLRYALDDRAYLQREVHKVLRKILPELDTGGLLPEIVNVSAISLPEVKIPPELWTVDYLRPKISQLQGLLRGTNDWPDESTGALLGEITHGFPKKFIRDCEQLVAGVGFREQARRKGLPEASYATLWRRRWASELSAMLSALEERKEYSPRFEQLVDGLRFNHVSKPDPEDLI